MRIGTLLPATDPAAVPDAVAAARGVDTLWTNQHPGGADPLAVLAAVASGPAAPPEVGTAVVATWPRHPVTTATEARTVGALGSSHLVLGLGPSHEWYMTGQLGIPYTAPAAHTREYLEVLRPLLRGEHVTHRGRFFTVDTQVDVATAEPTVLLSALGPRMLQVARDLADGTVAVWARPALVADHLVPALGDGARIVAVVAVAVSADPERTRGEVAEQFAAVRDMPAYRAVLDRQGLAGAQDTVVVGDEEHVAAELRRYADAGVTDLVLSPRGDAAARARALGVALDVRDAGARSAARTRGATS